MGGGGGEKMQKIFVERDPLISKAFKKMGKKVIYNHEIS